MSWQYIAGLFDGEGCITCGPKRSGRRRHFSINLNIVITMTHEEVITWLKDFTGMGLNCKPTSRNNKKHAVSYTFRVGAADQLHFLKSIRPFVIVKRQQVDLAISYRKHFEAQGKTWQMSEAEEQYRLQVYNEMRDLNKRGPK